MADTITVLDPITHAQFGADSAFWDIKSAVDSAVGTFPVPIPTSASQCRVIFDNLGAGALVVCRVRMTKTTSGSTPTKTETQVLEWTEARNIDVIETGTIDVSDSVATTLHIDCCLTEITTHTGTEIIVEIASETAVDDAWTTIARFLGPIGTAVTAPFANNEAIGQTILGLTDPQINDFDFDGKFKFIRGKAIADSEIIFQVSNTGD